MDQRRKFVPTSSPIRPLKAPRSRPSSEPPPQPGPEFTPSEILPEPVTAGTRPATQPESLSNSPGAADSPDSASKHARKRNWLSKLAKKNYLVHLMVNEPRLRWFLIVILSLAVVYVGLFARLWRVSPPESPQELYLRATDLIQQWSLHRAGLRAAAQGKSEIAIRTLMLASSINRFSDVVGRDLVTQVTRSTRFNHDWVYYSAGQLELLLSSANKNPGDLRLAAAFYSRFELYDFAIPRFRNPADCASSEAALLMLKAHYTVGNWESIPVVWQQYSNYLGGVPEASLYRIAGLAMASDSPAVDKKIEELRSIANDSTNAVRNLALHLLIQIDAARLNLVEVRRSLAILEDVHDEQVNDYLYLAETLDGVGLTQEARKQVQSIPGRTMSVYVAEHQLRVWSKLGLDSLAIDFVHHQLVEQRFHYRLILAITPMLVKTGKIEEVRNLAVYVRQVSYLTSVLGPYDVYLNAHAELLAGNRPKSELLFQQFVDLPPSFKPAVLQIAQELNSCGFATIAVRLLDKAAIDFGSSVSAWGEVQAIAVQARSSKLLLQSSRRLHELKPDDRVTANNYAASLLLTRNHAAEAISLTLPLITDYPQLVGPRVNHAVALIQLGRTREAEMGLNGIDPNQLPSEERTGCYFAWTICQSELGHPDNVRLGNAQIDRGRLFPEQISWLEECLAKLPEQITK